MQNSGKPVSPSSNAKEDKVETISELARKHLTNEHHTTSDEELKNAKLELTGNGEAPDETVTEADNIAIYPGRNDDNKEGGESSAPNPYDVLGS